MFRIRRIFDDTLPINKRDMVRVLSILRSQFPEVPPAEIDSIPQRLTRPFTYGFRYYLFVAEDGRGSIKGCALVSHEPRLGVCYLDYIATGRQTTGGGVGGALYERIRDSSRALGVIGLFFECRPDVPAEVSPEELAINIARLRFYEGFGARPIINNDYRAPVTPEGVGMPYLVFDPLDQKKPLHREHLQQIVRAILERKYSGVCPPEYNERVISSFRDDPAVLRPFLYTKAPERKRPKSKPALEPITLVVNDKHEIHHIKERGYVESPVRIEVMLEPLMGSGLFREVKPKEYPEQHIRAVHDAGFLEYFKQVCKTLPHGKSVYPYVFPMRSEARPPKKLAPRAGFYCTDTFTPLNRNAYPAARRAVDCALTAADALLAGSRAAYALVRPPGHHATRRTFGGFCYLNAAAVAAHYLSQTGRVAILDVDYHHGNGQQDIFYQRDDVFTVSIHADPDSAYPFFSGFANERGAGPGEGYNLNIPLQEQVDGPNYLVALNRAREAIRDFNPVFLVVALGLDPAKGDPTGTWLLRAADFEQNGRMIAGLSLPTLITQEGGYRTRTLGNNALHFFRGLVAAGDGV